MTKRILRLIIAAAVLLSADRLSSAQRGTPPGEDPGPAVLRTALQAHIGTGKLPADVIGTGKLTRGSQPAEQFKFFLKGSQFARYEYGDGRSRSVSIYKGGSGSRVSQDALKYIERHAALKRPMLIPFMDLLSEVENVGNTALEISYRGAVTLETAKAHHVRVTLKDPAPQIRLFGRAQDEVVDFYIDTGTFLVLRSVRYDSAENNMEVSVPSIVDFSDYRIVGGMQIPFRIINTVGSSYLSVTQSTLILETVTFNQGVADSLFDPR
jgi:hypothetical protein